MHVQPIEELYQVRRKTLARASHLSLTLLLSRPPQIAWRPGPVSSFPAFPAEIPAAPTPSSTAESHAPAHAATSAPKPTGAYRPPGARGTLTPTIFKREDEGGAPSHPPGGAGASTNGTSAATFQPGRRRHVPGAPVPGAENGAVNGAANGKQSKKGKKSAAGSPAGSAPQTPSLQATNSALEPISANDGDGDAEATQKKIRNLSKKVCGHGNRTEMEKEADVACSNNPQLKAITELKDKMGKGEVLEATQIKKIEGEKAILKELAGLEATLKK